MKEATMPTGQPRSDAEIEREIERLFGEIEQMLKQVGRSNAAAALHNEGTARNIRWIEEKLNVGKVA